MAKIMNESKTKHPLNIAHRGASGEYVENTLEAFRLALRQGADAIEMDIHQTRDGKLIVHHDLDLLRLAGINKNIKALSLGEIRGLKLRVRRRGSVLEEKIPTLEETIRLIKKKAILFLEIKKGGRYYPGIEQRLIRVLRRHGLTRRVVVSSFEVPVLKRFRQLSSALHLGLLTREKNPASILRTARSLHAGSVHISSKRISQNILEKVHQAKLPVFVYTVNSKFQMRRLVKMGADGFFTDYPGRLTGFLKTILHPARS